MARSDSYEMSHQLFALSYDGTKAGPIDVEALGPALLAVGKLIREANFEVNGKKSKTKVVVRGDFEQKCFHVNFEAVLGVLAAVHSFLDSDYVKDAKKVLQIIGFVKPEEGQISLLQYLKMRAGKEIENKSELADKDENGCVHVKIEGNENRVSIKNYVFQLSENPKALKATRDAFAPIGQDGFEELQISDEKGVFESISPDATQAIIASCNAGIEEIKEEKELPDDFDVSPAWLIVYSPVYDRDAVNWRFRMGRDIIYVDISETKIVEDALARGGSLAEDSYQVQLEITTPVDATGKRGNPTYKIMEVMKFVPAKPSLRQASLFDG